ncbi:MAG TPA: hypothetical protein VJH87_02200 [Vicinamibacteria bacterium]|nr:hypothetical protein [Vicinamibacteria bacterium]
MIRKTILLSLLTGSSLFPLAAPLVAEDSPVYLVYYWRAPPGKAALYSEYIRKVAEPIDEEGRKAGVFEEVHTYTQQIVTGAPGSDWTHVRIFKLRSFASWDQFSAGLDEAAKRAFPDEEQRKRLQAPAGELRDLVRQEIWRAF